MKDLISHKSRTNIIPITRKVEGKSESIIAAVNKVAQFFHFDGTDQKRERLAKVIYTLNLLDIKQDDLVFELDTTDGLNAAILAEMGARVLTVSADKFTSLKAINAISTATKDRIQIITVGEIAKVSRLAPFDKILVGPSVSNIPMDLYGVLALNGKLVVTEKNNSAPVLLQITRTTSDTFDVKKKFGLQDKSASYEVFDL